MAVGDSPKNYKKARYKGELRSLFILMLFTFGAAPAVLAWEFGTEEVPYDFVSAYGVIVSVIVVALFLIRLMQRQFLGNALKIEQGRFGNLKNYSGAIAETLGQPEPDIFIFQEPYLNAFAIGFKRPYTICLHSALVETLDPEETTAILAHEMGHIYFGHTRIMAFMAPVGGTVPVLSYLMGFWGRKAELSCDRLALYLTQNPRAVIDALIKIHVGPRFLDQLDAEGVLFQDYHNRGVMGDLAQTMGSHPFLTTRVKKILALSQELGVAYIDKSGRTVCINCGLKMPTYAQHCERCQYALTHNEALRPQPEIQPAR